MGDLEDVGAGFADLDEQPGQAARQVGDDDAEVEVATGGREPVPDHLAEQQGVDVAAGEYGDDRDSRSASGCP